MHTAVDTDTEVQKDRSSMTERADTKVLPAVAAPAAEEEVRLLRARRAAACVADGPAACARVRTRGKPSERFIADARASQGRAAPAVSDVPDMDAVFKVLKAFSHAHRAAQPPGWETSTVSDPFRFRHLVDLQAPFNFVSRESKNGSAAPQCADGNTAPTSSS
jgi:hypothetical protein